MRLVCLDCEGQQIKLIGDFSIFQLECCGCGNKSNTSNSIHEIMNQWETVNASVIAYDRSSICMSHLN